MKSYSINIELPINEETEEFFIKLKQTSLISIKRLNSKFLSEKEKIKKDFVLTLEELGIIENTEVIDNSVLLLTHYFYKPTKLGTIILLQIP